MASEPPDLKPAGTGESSHNATGQGLRRLAAAVSGGGRHVNLRVPAPVGHPKSPPPRRRLGPTQATVMVRQIRQGA